MQAARLQKPVASETPVKSRRAHEQSAEDERPPADAIRERSGEWTREHGGHLDAEQNADLGRGPRQDLMREERHERADGAIHEELPGLRKADREDPAIADHLADAGRGAAPPRGGLVMRRLVGPVPQHEQCAYPQHGR